jgi:hypothetical protein
MWQRAILRNPSSGPRRVCQASAGSYLVCCLLFAAAANAQFFAIQSASFEGSRRRPIIADVILQTTSVTPWGTYTQILKGKFWRSRRGEYRQDDAFGTSFLFSSKKQTWVDRELRTATLVAPSGPRVGLVAWTQGPRSLGKKVVSGRTVEGQGSLGPFGEDGYELDTWLDMSLGIPLQIRLRTGTTEVVQELSNIEERDPDPELFKVPQDLTLFNCAPKTSRGRGQLSSLPARCREGPINSR